MLKKFLLAFSIFCAVFSLTAADAKPQISVFRGDPRPQGKILTVLAAPAEISADVPENEHFFMETLEQVWNEVIDKMEANPRFIFRTEERVLDFENAFPETAGGTAERDEKPAATLAAIWSTDAVMTLTVTEAITGIISHDEQTRWNPGVRLGGGYWRGGWHPRGGVSIQRETVPAYDEFYSTVSLKIEIRDANDGQDTLLYGISARDTARSGMLPNAPSLTKMAEALVRAAAAELAKL